MSIFSCGKQDWSQVQSVPFKTESNAEDAVELENNQMVVDSAMLFVSSISIEGTRLQGDPVNLFLSSNELVDLTLLDQLITAQLPKGTYDQLTVRMTFSEGGSVIGQMSKINGNPNTKNFEFPLDYDEVDSYMYDLVESSDGGLLTIEEGQQLIWFVDFQKTMEGIGNNGWNGLLNANQSQNNIDLLTLAGQEFLVNFKDNLLAKARLILK